MPSSSKKQGKFFGAVMGCKKNPSKCTSPKLKKVAKSMTEKQIKDFLVVKKEK
jgi:hypothetical protein